MYSIYGKTVPYFGKKVTALIATLAILTNSLVASLPFIIPQSANAITNYTQIPFSATELSSNWSKDRTTPSGGYDSTSFGGRNDVLEMRVDTTAPSPTSGFYRTEGIQRQITPSSTVKADIYVDSSWYSQDVRAGLWAVAKDASDITAYPIVEFIANNGGTYTGWRVWDGVNGGWTNTSTAYTPNAWNTLEISLNTTTDQFNILINGSLITTNAGGGSTNIGAVILNNFNNANNNATYNYATRWSKLAVGTVAPPTVAPCTSTTVFNTTDLSTWYLGETRTSGSNQIVEDGLHATTLPDGGDNSLSKAAGYYATNFSLENAGVPNIEFASYSGVRPGLQLGVDKDANGSWDGYLVYEPWDYGVGNFWSSKNFGIASGGGYTSMGTLNDYLAANPNAKVTSIGYSLGSGVIGDAVISKLTAGCVDYTFNIPAPPSTTVTVTGNTSTGENQPGWLFNRELANSTPYQFNGSDHSIGTGSLNILPIGSTPTDKMVAENFLDTPIADVHSVKYDFKIGGSGVNSDKDQFYMNVYANYGSSAPTKYYDCRYDVIPVAGSTSGFTTVIFDPSQTYAVTTRSGSPACPSSPDGMNAISAGSRIRMFSLNVGDTSASDAGIGGYLDNVVVRTSSAITTYDFEPLPAPATPSNLRLSNVNGEFTCGLVTSINYITAKWDAVAGVASYNYRVVLPGGSLFGPNNVGNVTSVSGAFGGEGLSTFSVQAVGVDGQVSDWATPCAVTYDSAVPSAPTNPRWENSAGVTLGAYTNVNLVTPAWDAPSVGPVDHYEYSFSSPISSWSAPEPFYTTSIPDQSFFGGGDTGTEGTWQFRVRTVTASGLRSDWAESPTIIYDKTLPAVPTNLRMNESGGDAIANGGLTNSYGVTAGWDSVTDADHYDYRYWNSIPGNIYNAPNYYDVVAGSNSRSGEFNQGDGLHHFQVRSVDSAGNASDWSSVFDVNYDGTTPSLPTAGFREDPSGDSVANGGLTDSQNFAFTLGSSIDTTRYQLKYWNDIIGSPFKELTPWNPTDLSGYPSTLGTYGDNFSQGDGVHYFSFSACDAAGNCSAYSAPFKVTFDKTAPAVSIDSFSASGNVITPVVTVTDSNGPLTYSWSTNPNVTISDVTAMSPSFTANSDGTYTFILTAADSAGNSATASFSFTYTTPAPTPTSGSGTPAPAPPGVQGASTTPFTNVAGRNSNNRTAPVPEVASATDEPVVATAPQVEGASTEKSGATAGDSTKKVVAASGNFLWLGWWWLPLIVLLGFLFWLLFARDDKDDEDK